MNSTTGPGGARAGGRRRLRVRVRARPAPPRLAPPQPNSRPIYPYWAREGKCWRGRSCCFPGTPTPPIRSIRPQRLDVSDIHAVGPAIQSTTTGRGHKEARLQSQRAASTQMSDACDRGPIRSEPPLGPSRLSGAGLRFCTTEARRSQRDRAMTPRASGHGSGAVTECPAVVGTGVGWRPRSGRSGRTTRWRRTAAPLLRSAVVASSDRSSAPDPVCRRRSLHLIVSQLSAVITNNTKHIIK